MLLEHPIPASSPSAAPYASVHGLLVPVSSPRWRGCSPISGRELGSSNLLHKNTLSAKRGRLRQQPASLFCIPSPRHQQSSARFQQQEDDCQLEETVPSLLTAMLNMEERMAKMEKGMEERMAKRVEEEVVKRVNKIKRNMDEEACIKADENKEKMKRLEENFAAKLEEVAARVEEVKLEMEKEGLTRVKEAREDATIQIKKELTTALLQDWDYDPAEQRY